MNKMRSFKFLFKLQNRNFIINDLYINFICNYVWIGFLGSNPKTLIFCILTWLTCWNLIFIAWANHLDLLGSCVGLLRQFEWFHYYVVFFFCWRIVFFSVFAFFVLSRSLWSEWPGKTFQHMQLVKIHPLKWQISCFCVISSTRLVPRTCQK